MSNNWERRFEERPLRTGLSFGTGIVLIMLALGVVGGAGVFAINLLSQPARIASKTFDADNVIYNYEWFRQQYQDVGAIDVKIATTAEAAQAADGDEKVRLNSIVTGLKTKRAQMVADYNARGSMANRSIFIAGLPQQIQ